VSGSVRIGENEKGERTITVVADDGSEDEHVVSRRAHVVVADGSEVAAGQRLVGEEKTPLDPKKLLEIRGIRETQQYLCDEVQRVYREQGVSIHDKHVEVIVRQMLRRVAVSEPGDSPFLPGEKVDARVYADTNRRLVEEGKQPAEGRPELMGITKASLATDSWLSAASFQETTRVLTEAAIEGKSDGLLGLKENVIIGKLIPAGTGMPQYREIATDAPDYEPLPFYTSDTEADMDLASWLADSAREAAPTEPAALGDGGFLSVAPEPTEAELAAVEAVLEVDAAETATDTVEAAGAADALVSAADEVAEEETAEAGAALADVAGLIASDAAPSEIADAEDRAEEELAEARDATAMADATETLADDLAEDAADETIAAANAAASEETSASEGADQADRDDDGRAAANE